MLWQLPPRWRQKIEVDPASCWIWHGAVDRHGYGIAGWPQRYAHRAIWTVVHGPIAPGLHLHHVCFVRRCVRPHPDHLELLSKRDHRRERHRRYTPEERAERQRLYLARWQARQRERGLCRLCAQLALPGLRSCLQHNQAQHRYDAARRARQLRPLSASQLP